MKRFYSYLMVMAALVFSGGKIMAADDMLSTNINDVVYTAYSGANYATVTSYNFNGANDSIVIPATVEINHKEYPVKVIGGSAFSNKGDLRSVTLPEGITTIESYAFAYGYSHFTNINLPKSIETIGSYAFHCCDQLKFSGQLENIRSIGNYAFYECNRLATITIPDGVTEIGSYAFTSCDDLSSVTLPKGITTIKENTFYDCNNLTTITIPEGVTSIETNAFYSCDRLATVVLPKSMKSLGHQAFYDCRSLATITYPEEMRLTNVGSNAFANTQIALDNEGGILYFASCAYGLSDRSLEEYVIKEGTTAIMASLFANCTNMKSITIPTSVETIGENAFSGCKSLPIENGIRYADCYAIEVTDKTLTDYTLNENVRFLGNELFRNCSAMTAMTIPAGVTSIGDRTFYGCSSLATISIPEGLKSIGTEAFYNCSALTAIDVPAGTTSIGNNAFQNCTSLATATLAEGLTYIGQYAFYNCSALTAINIPAGVTSIGARTFYDCTSLQSATLGTGLTGIGEYAFYNCKILGAIDIPAGVKTIDRYAFHGCLALTSATLGEGLTSIGEYAFYNCSALKAIDIPAGVTNIGQDAFNRCKTLASAALAESVTTIGRYAFYECKALKSIKIPAGVTRLESNTFQYCDALKSVTLPEGLIFIGSHAFNSCDALESVTIPSTVQEIQNNAFSSCYALKSANLPGGLTALGTNVFGSCSKLTSVEISQGIKEIPSGTFSYCSSLTEVIIPEGVTSIANEAFYSCSSLRTFVWPSTLKYVGYSNLSSSQLEIRSQATTPPTIENGCNNQFIYVPEGYGVAYKELYPNNIIIEGNGTNVVVNITEAGTFGEEVLKQVKNLADVNHLTVKGTLNDTDIEAIKNSVPNLISIDLSGLDMKTIPNSFLYGKKGITKAVLPNNTEVIGQEAFRGCVRLKEIKLPETLTTINYAAFYEAGLNEIEIPAGVTTIGTYAFNNCYYLESVNIPVGVTRIEEYTFSNCRSLKSIELPENVTYLGRYAFRGCQSLTSAKLSNNITQIDEYAFQDCSSLPSITLPQELTTIGSYAFCNCDSFTELEIPSKVTALKYYSFAECDRLKTVTVNEGLRNLGERAFRSCDSLHTVNLPGTLILCGTSVFEDCSSLKNVTCQALFPPTVNSTIAPNVTCVLYAPEWTLEKYKLASGWSGFGYIEPISGVYPNDITVYKEDALSIPENGLPQDYKPNITLSYYDNSNVGKLTVRGDMPLTISTFEIEQTRDKNLMTSLINNGNLSADKVVTKISMSTGTWHYLTFPYDVKVSDIVTEGGDWIICYYDGEARAQADFSNTWKTVPFDSILHAGQGYIWHSTKGRFTVPSVANNNRNLVFAKEARYIQLKEHAASTTANYGWNLIGNPFPCYYDTRFMEFTSPITVRNGNSYAAYSPVDDSYILMPNEAFFVQCSADNNVAGFTLDGRQTNTKVREITSAPSMNRGATTDRCVLNLYLENNSYADHTRLVVNEKAEMAYEISCDASKFMSDDTTVPQLFTFIDEERMAINERPLADGKAALGIYIGIAGTHTISLDTKATDAEVVLIDKLTGIETDLTTFSYDFTAEAGTYTDRFEIVMKRTGETGITEATAGTVKVVAMPGVINVTNATAPINVYNAAGALVTTKSGDAVTIEVEPGVYVVKVGSEAHKVSVVK